MIIEEHAFILSERSTRNVLNVNRISKIPALDPIVEVTSSHSLEIPSILFDLVLTLNTNPISTHQTLGAPRGVGYRSHISHQVERIISIEKL